MTKHCCEMMRSNVESTCGIHASRYECPDALIDYWPKLGTYGIIVHDAGESMIGITFCPWCGTDLSNSSGTQA